MAAKSWRRRNSSRTPWATTETKEGKLAVRRLVSPKYHDQVRSIYKCIDESKLVMGRGVLYAHNYARVTLISTQELPSGKKYRTPDIVGSVPSCSEGISVDLGKFIVARRPHNKPKLAIEVISSKLNRELDDLQTSFESRNLQLRGDISAEVNPPHLSLAEIDEDHQGYFSNTVLDELTLAAGGQVNEVGGYLGRILLSPVLLPRNT